MPNANTHSRRLLILTFVLNPPNSMEPEMQPIPIIINKRIAYTTKLSTIYDSLGDYEKRNYYDNISSKLFKDNVNKEVARRIVDFISGGVFALDGHIQKISNSIFLVAPFNYEITNEVMKEDIKNKLSVSWIK